MKTIIFCNLFMFDKKTDSDIKFKDYIYTVPNTVLLFDIYSITSPL